MYLIRASNIHFTTDAAPVTALPMTLFVRARRTTSVNGQYMSPIGIMDKDDSDRYYYTSINAPDGGNNYQVNMAQNALGDVVFQTTRDWAQGQWANYVLVARTTTTRGIATLGAPNVAGATYQESTGTARIADAWDRLALGRVANTVPLHSFDGDLELAAVWSIDLTAIEAAAVALGQDPATIRPASLVFLADIDGSPRPRIGNFTITKVNGPRGGAQSQFPFSATRALNGTQVSPTILAGVRMVGM